MSENSQSHYDKCIDNCKKNYYNERIGKISLLIECLEVEI